MTDQHPITPPPELVREWIEKYGNSEDPSWQTYEQDIATQAARWGADQELEACCEWVRSSIFIDFDDLEVLRASRRPEPPSLKEQALEALGPEPLPESNPTGDAYLNRGAIERHHTIRAALEALPND